MKKIKKGIPMNKKENTYSYLKESLSSIKIIIVIFVISILFGFINASNMPQVKDLLREIIDQTSTLSGLDLIIFIFINNTVSSFLSLILGIFLGIFPLITTTFNGIILGYVMNKTVVAVGFLELWRLFPHGIFELPAVFISLGLGLNLGLGSIKNYLKENKKNLTLKILGILSLFLALFGIMLLRLSLNIIKTNASIALPGLLFSIVLLTPFISLFFVVNKKVRDFNIKKIMKSLKIFFTLVIPLLIIGAVIEGLLITIL